MTNDQNPKNMKDQLLEDIRSGEVSMKPKLFFTLKLALFFIVALLVIIISVFIFNFILFSLRLNGHDVLLEFGPSGWGAFVHFFPWHLLALDILLVVLLEWLLRQFRFGYKIPALYLLAGLIALTLLTGLFIDRGTLLNDRIYEMHGGGLPAPLGALYEGAEQPLIPGRGLCRCTVLGVQGNVLIVEDTRGATTTLRIVLPLNNPYATTSALKEGDVVLIAGKEEDGVIEAFGVRKVPDRIKKYPRRFSPESEHEEKKF